MKFDLIIYFVFLCIFLCGCGREIDITSSNEYHANADTENPKATTNGKLNLGKEKVIYVTVFPTNVLDHSYVIELDATGVITTYYGVQATYGDRVCEDIGLVREDVKKVLRYSKKSEKNLSDSEIKMIEESFNDIDFATLKKNRDEYKRDEIYDIWEYSLWLEEEGFYWYDLEEDYTGLWSFINKTIEISPLKVDVDTSRWLP